MATGDATDILARLRSLLPPWFPSSAPVLDAVLTGSATASSWVYGRISYVTLQTRLKSMSGPFLDLFANDFFGFGGYLRAIGETDASYVGRIEKEIFRERQTRYGVDLALYNLTPYFRLSLNLGTPMIAAHMMCPNPAAMMLSDS